MNRGLGLASLALAFTLAGCATGPATLNIPRDAAMQAVGQAHQACKDGKLSKEACKVVDKLVASAVETPGMSQDVIAGLVGQLLPLLTGALTGALAP